jgi:predicted  nucleic acid-binding Zn-ribbon protein
MATPILYDLNPEQYSLGRNTGRFNAVREKAQIQPGLDSLTSFISSLKVPVKPELTIPVAPVLPETLPVAPTAPTFGDKPAVPDFGVKPIAPTFGPKPAVPDFGVKPIAPTFGDKPIAPSINLPTVKQLDPSVVSRTQGFKGYEQSQANYAMAYFNSKPSGNNNFTNQDYLLNRSYGSTLREKSPEERNLLALRALSGDPKARANYLPYDAPLANIVAGYDSEKSTVQSYKPLYDTYNSEVAAYKSAQEAATPQIDAYKQQVNAYNAQAQSQIDQYNQQGQAYKAQAQQKIGEYNAQGHQYNAQAQAQIDAYNQQGQQYNQQAQTKIADYNAQGSAYNQQTQAQIDEYNQQGAAYNAQIAPIKAEIDRYNTEVNKYKEIADQFNKEVGQYFSTREGAVNQFMADRQNMDVSGTKIPATGQQLGDTSLYADQLHQEMLDKIGAVNLEQQQSKSSLYA